MKRVEIFTDGACRGNPGPGGWGAILRFGEVERELYGYQAETTNNQMEMQAVIEALQALNQSCSATITTDSKYVIQGMTEWLPGWKQKGWKNSAGKPVKNQALWQTLDSLCQQHKLEWSWVKGHTGHPENERCDALANRAIDENIGT